MKVSFVELKPQHDEIKAELDAAVREVVDNCWFIQGKPVKQFEAELASSFGLKHACGVSNGTAAISMTLRALKIAPGDEVITTVHTAIPTAEAIVLAGGKVVFCDVEEATYNINPAAIEAAITPRTKAILPVHLYGLPVKLDEIKAIAAKRGVALVEDCAQAQGAAYDGRPVGSHGVAGCLSFFPSKSLGGWGDGGAVVTDDAGIEKFVRMYSNHGRTDKYLHEFCGSNERLDTLQAAVLRLKLARLETWNVMRRQVASWYEELLAGVEGIALPRPIAKATPCWHLYVAMLDDREGFMKFMQERGVGTALHYPLALHMQPAFAHLGHKPGAFPVAERVTSRCVSLPMFPHLTRPEVEHVCDSIRAWFKR